MGTSEDCSILESNSLNMNNLDTLGGELHDLVERRRVLGPCYRLFYNSRFIWCVGGAFRAPPW